MERLVSTAPLPASGTGEPATVSTFTALLVGSGCRGVSVAAGSAGALPAPLPAWTALPLPPTAAAVSLVPESVRNRRFLAACGCPAPLSGCEALLSEGRCVFAPRLRAAAAALAGLETAAPTAAAAVDVSSSGSSNAPNKSRPSIVATAVLPRCDAVKAEDTTAQCRQKHRRRRRV